MIARHHQEITFPVAKGVNKSGLPEPVQTVDLEHILEETIDLNLVPDQRHVGPLGLDVVGEQVHQGRDLVCLVVLLDPFVVAALDNLFVIGREPVRPKASHNIQQGASIFHMSTASFNVLTSLRHNLNLELNVTCSHNLTSLNLQIQSSLDLQIRRICSEHMILPGGRGLGERHQDTPGALLRSQKMLAEAWPDGTSER